MSIRKAQSFINGEWLTTDREKQEIKNPFTGEVIGEQYFAQSDDVEIALATAYKGKKQVKNIPIIERSKILKKAAYLLEENKEKFAKLLSSELGKPLKDTLGEVDRSIETLELSGEEAKRLHGETIPGSSSERGLNTIASIYRVPVGVVAAITPFNAPLNLVCHKVGPAFAGGNVTLLKPAPQTTLIATAFLQLLFEAGFPKNAIHMLLGGVDVGQQIVKDERINVISFTGGLVASRNISQIAGIKKTLFELGGNAATIVHQDADIETAARLCAKTGYSNSGQSCISVQRIYVQEEIKDNFIELLKQEVSKLKVGDPLDPHTDIGTLVDEKAAGRVIEWINEAVESGAEIIQGGTKNGASVEPTVLFNPPKKSKVVCEEVFGPIVSVIPYKNIEEAIQESNDSPFGLQTGIFTNQIDLAYRVADEMEVGGIVINGTSNFRLDHLPYGGVKNSGIGREGPRYALEEMTESKMVVLRV
ncbi:aldehyde dehydrogenase [Oceanobacillus iheyensis HTE831]|uniref:Aldehyde dehydrogenase n=1 Tax=Oceanobacillus iheyensis (strain DSM 14371 / CIP 107618 / JCM 11309 / KCTC 3954 / HTE831) TaxID=221109 RepID=Q8ELI8_OCEIH|nr:aldehyde dehydrogenase family protein [Oceanobacillus iheyensis]BAC15195.1 aldehyde dehydrogenase [Oceanobacillus iheyensis HTE831]